MKNMLDTWVLDSYAVLALLQGESGAEDVLKQIDAAQQGKSRVLMTWVNVGEVLYTVERRRGAENVPQVLGLLEASALEFVDVDRGLALKAATIKANYRLAYADAFAAALAMREDAPLITGDPEFRQLEDQVAIHWLAPN
jgi:predicted nucleic acid-binding protein